MSALSHTYLLHLPKTMSRLVIDYFAAGSVGMTFNIPGTWPLNSSSSDDIEAAERSWQWNVSTLILHEWITICGPLLVQGDEGNPLLVDLGLQFSSTFEQCIYKVDS